MPQSALDLVRSAWERLTSHPSGAPSPWSEGELLVRLMRHLPGMVYRCRVDRAWTMEYVSPGCRALTGFDARDLVGNRVTSFASLIHPDDRERVWQTVQNAVLEDRPFRTTYRIRRVDGAVRHVWEYGAAVLGIGGEAEAVEGYITDITDREELESRLEAHESGDRALVEQALVGVYIVRNGRYEYVNPRFAEIFGYTPTDILALPSTESLVHPEDRDLVAQHVRARLRGEADEARYELRGLHRDGTTRELAVHGRVVLVDGRPAIMGVLLDVTEQKRRQRRDLDAQKMEALGRLATGVAHDFNNVLTAIMATAELASGQVGGSSVLAKDLEEIIRAASRGAGLTRQLMAFGRGAPAHVTAVSLNDVVEGLRPMLDRLMPEGVTLSASVTRRLPIVDMDPAHAEELVMNLVLNARDAMPDGGQVRVVVRGQETGGPTSSADVATLPHVVLEVSDNGTGIATSVRARIFEPYFTTKGSAGNGLGLANVWRIVRGLRGVIEVESEPGAGSTFRLLLPARQPGFGVGGSSS